MTEPTDTAARTTVLDDREALRLAEDSDVATMMDRAACLRDAAWGPRLTYSPKVFLPITNLCRNRCDYCKFRRSPGESGEWTLSPAEIESTLRRGRETGCAEALFCLGDTPETAFPTYRELLRSYGHERTVDYLEWAGARALAVGLLPHTNAGLLSRDDMCRLRPVNVSFGLMLENVSPRLCERGMPHHRAPDKRPERRLEMLREAGELRIPFTTGILIGIGETRRERAEALLAIRDLHLRYGHIQEVIVQNFTPHAGTRMAETPEPSAEDLARAVALARLVLPPDVSVQSPPNLNAERIALLVAAGVNDFGGISPLTPDYINPDRPWPHVEALRQNVESLGHELAPRLPIYDSYVKRAGFLDPALARTVHEAGRTLGLGLERRAS